MKGPNKQINNNKLKQGIEKLANLLKNINKTLGKLTQQSKRPLQVNGIAAISKIPKVSDTLCHIWPKASGTNLRAVFV